MPHEHKSPSFTTEQNNGSLGQRGQGVSGLARAHGGAIQQAVGVQQNKK